jgi:lipopolysaccharide export LptBFGC system permease protein LptF
MWVVVAGLVVLVLAGLFMGRAAAGQVPPVISYTVAALAAVVLGWRLARRGKR